jgi:hypothetical protein
LPFRDTGLDWNHRNIDWDNIWRNPKALSANSRRDDGLGQFAGDASMPRLTKALPGGRAILVVRIRLPT